MNAVTYALKQCEWTIPSEILDLVFLSGGLQQLTGYGISRSSRILETVIVPRVLTDCNLMGGREVVIPLEKATRQILDPMNSLFYIPKTLTQNSSISRALSVVYVNPNIGNNMVVRGLTTGFSTSPLLDGANSLLNAAAGPVVLSTAHCYLTGSENTILITGQLQILPNIALRCWLELDNNLSHLQPTSYDKFAQLVEYAVKAYIYNNRVIKMDQDQLMSGMTIGRFKEIVDSYSDAEQNYKDYKTNVFQRVLALNDPETKRRHLQVKFSAFR